MEQTFEDIGSGPALVLLHAFPLTRTMWQPQIADFTNAGFRLIVPDLKGFGTNTNSQKINTMEDSARFVLEILDQCGIRKAVFCGLSMGGYVTFNFYRLFPERCSALILCDTNYAADSEEKRSNRFELIKNIEENGTEALVENMLPKLISRKTLKTQTDLVLSLREDFRRTSPLGATAALRGMAGRADHEFLLEKIKIPTLLVFGEKDTVTNMEVAHKLKEKIPDSELSIIRSAGHYSSLEQPERFNRAVLNFLVRLRSTEKI